jgi:4-hydroxythreonine-4-phosphate dehydrogenase
VLGVNPHAGEGGLLGRDELDVVEPALERIRAAHDATVVGPVPADGFFADVARARGKRAALPHAVLAMSHDQGLGPYKLLSAGHGVNVTWGLRVPRTSPDHGTADAIAGQGIAESSSMQAAIEAAWTLSAPKRRPRG